MRKPPPSRAIGSKRKRKKKTNKRTKESDDDEEVANVEDESPQSAGKVYQVSFLRVIWGEWNVAKGVN